MAKIKSTKLFLIFKNINSSDTNKTSILYLQSSSAINRPPLALPLDCDFTAGTSKTLKFLVSLVLITGEHNSHDSLTHKISELVTSGRISCKFPNPLAF